MLKKEYNIDALAWKANCLGVSYGTLCLEMTEEKRDSILREYESFILRNNGENSLLIEKTGGTRRRRKKSS